MTDMVLNCQEWLHKEWLRERFGKKFKKTRLRVQDRGFYDFDAADETHSIVANFLISGLCQEKTLSSSAKKLKLRADCLMLSLVRADTKLMIFTEKSAYKMACREQDEGRLPLNIKLLFAEVPMRKAPKTEGNDLFA